VAFVINLMTKLGQTYDFTAKDFVNELEKYAQRLPDLVLIDSKKYPQEILELYKAEGGAPVVDNLTNEDFLVVRENISSDLVYEKPKGDMLKRSLIRHDPDKLAWELMKYLKPF